MHSLKLKNKNNAQKNCVNQLINHLTVWLILLPRDSLDDKIYKFSHVKDHADRWGSGHENSEDGFLSWTWDEAVHQVRTWPLITLHQPWHLETIVHHIQSIPGDTDIVPSNQNSHVRLTEKGSTDLTWILLQTAAWTPGCRHMSTRGHQLLGASAFSESLTPHLGPLHWETQLYQDSVAQDEIIWALKELSTTSLIHPNTHIHTCLSAFLSNINLHTLIDALGAN